MLLLVGQTSQKTDRWPKFICDECIELCNEIIEEELNEDMDVDLGASQAKGDQETLDQYVVGQEQAKSPCLLPCITTTSGSTAACMDDVELQSNVLLWVLPAAGKPFLPRLWPRY